MSKLYTTNLALASEQLQRSERAASENPNNTVYTQHRRHNSLSGRVCSKSLTKSASITDITQKLDNIQYDPITLSDRITTATNRTREDILSCSNKHQQRTLPHRDDHDEVDCDEFRRRRLPATSIRNELNATKDGLLETSSTINSSSISCDEPDHLQHRFSRTSQACAKAAAAAASSTSLSSTALFNTRHNHHSSHLNCSSVDSTFSDAGCTSGMSSAFSSPCPSTVSSPLSTPTRLSPQLQHNNHHNHQLQQQHVTQTCCQQKSIAPVKNSCSSTASSSLQQHHQHNNHHHLPEHHHQQQQQHPKPSLSSPIIVNGSKNFKKFDPRLGPSPYRQLLPIALCILSFATVFSILIVYMDTTEIRHQQFRLNMSRDSEFYGVSQDDPQLIAFLREIHMCKYPMHLFKTTPTAGDNSLPGTGGGGGSGSGISGNALNGLVETHLNLSAYPNELTPKMAYYVANLMQGKTNGAVIQSLTGSLGHLMTAPWLSKTLNWAGVIVEPEPRRYFTLRKQNALRPHMQVVHACVSPNPYPKEITIHNEESEVRINSLLDEETSWFNSRVKCFPLYTIMLASNRVEYDLLSLGVHGHELEILQTLPFDKIKIEIISIHLLENQEDVTNYVQTLTKFLQGKSYKLQKKFGRNYFYQRLAKTTQTTPTRTRKKDILLLKTP